MGAREREGESLPPPAKPADAFDAEIEERIAEYVDRLNAGQRLDPSEIIAENPGHGEEILASLECFIDLERPSRRPSHKKRLGDYVLLREVGRGGMAVVWEALDMRLGRHVALKVLPGGQLASRTAIARFKREAKVAARLSHENIVPIYGMGAEDDTLYFAMELVHGRTLEHLRPSEVVEPESG